MEIGRRIAKSIQSAEKAIGRGHGTGNTNGGGQIPCGSRF